MKKYLLVGLLCLCFCGRGKSQTYLAPGLDLSLLNLTTEGNRFGNQLFYGFNVGHAWSNYGLDLGLKYNNAKVANVTINNILIEPTIKIGLPPRGEWSRTYIAVGSSINITGGDVEGETALGLVGGFGIQMDQFILELRSRIRIDERVEGVDNDWWGIAIGVPIIISKTVEKTLD